MKPNTIFIVLIAIVLVSSLFFDRAREMYTLPNTKDDGMDICPDGFVLKCVSKLLPGVDDVIPFPASLPKPCEDTHTPLCLPGPEHTKPAYSKK